MIKIFLSEQYMELLLHFNSYNKLRIFKRSKYYISHAPHIFEEEARVTSLTFFPISSHSLKCFLFLQLLFGTAVS